MRSNREGALKIRVNGVELAYRVDGEGPWLLMSHSIACDLSMWDAQVAALSARFRILRYDLRGHGASEVPPGPYTLDMLAEDAHGLLAALGIEHCHWLGLSIGGIIGQVFALKHPGMLDTLVLADTASRMPPEALPGWDERIRLASASGMAGMLEPNLGRWFTAGFRAREPEIVAKISRLVLATPVAGYIGCAHAVPTINVTHRLKEVRCPALVIVGELDPTSPPAMAREIHEALPGSELAVIASAAHLCNIEQPRAFNRVLGDFLERHRRRRMNAVR